MTKKESEAMPKKTKNSFKTLKSKHTTRTQQESVESCGDRRVSDPGWLKKTWIAFLSKPKGMEGG